MLFGKKDLLFKILKGISFPQIENRFPDYNHEIRRSISRKLTQQGCKVIMDKNNSDDEDLD